eukprot:TRINITY_DN876_c0_g1_i2.p1 TRINITY_DN876_c0_g1~~TRINITY_DN876_c0_g1_i2.p1  ORF type:complete len:101 (+),score=19.75 TRINITY_DN876_c0_g1_i2:98-400(+)
MDGKEEREPYPLPPIPQYSITLSELLASLEMSNYLDAFLAEEIRIRDLVSLTPEDMELLVPRIGPRRRLQSYIDTYLKPLHSMAMSNVASSNGAAAQTMS